MTADAPMATPLEARPRPALPRRRRILVAPLAVAVGLGISTGVYFLLSGTPTDAYALNGPSLLRSLVGQILLSGVSFAVVTAICVPLGVLMGISGRGLRLVVFPLANLGQAVPGIGVLALLWVVFGIGAAPAIIALIAYSALPILRSTMVGIESVDPAAVEAARGMGMTRGEALRRVQIPLAAPLILAGMRTALVLIIGTATLGTFIGAGGLGDIIDAGINISDRIVFVGAVMVATLALLADWALSLVEDAVTPRYLRARARRTS